MVFNKILQGMQGNTKGYPYKEGKNFDRNHPWRSPNITYFTGFKSTIKNVLRELKETT